MTDGNTELAPGIDTTARAKALESGDRDVARYLVGGVIVAAFIGLAAVTLVPQQIQEALTRGASKAEDMQVTAAPGIGIDTAMPESPDLNAEPNDPAEPAAVEPPGTSEAERIAALEAEIEALRAAQGEDPDVNAILEEQAQRLQEEFEREREQLERRIEEAQNRQTGPELRTAGVIPEIGGGETEQERRARERREAERARRAAIREEQINSESIVIDGAANVRGSGNGAAGAPAGNGRELTAKEQFMSDAVTQPHETARAGHIPAPRRTIVQGTTLQATLETAISTELPGVIRAVVSRDVYSYDGSNVLLPRGTRLIGSYNSDVSVVQGRVQMAWSRAITPTGVSVELGGYGADRLGRSGQAGFVDGRFRQRFASAALISLIGAGPQVFISEDASESEEDIAGDVGGDLERSTQGVVADYLSASPVIHVDQGVELTVFVNRDLVF